MRGASSKEKDLIVIEDSIEFSNRVGIIDWAEDVEPLGFVLSSPSALFPPSKAKALQDFCAKNREYHIVSVVGDYIYRNKYVKGCNTYLLADKDANPNILRHPYINRSFAEYHEELHQKFAAKFTEIHGRSNRIFNF